MGPSRSIGWGIICFHILLKKMKPSRNNNPVSGLVGNTAVDFFTLTIIACLFWVIFKTFFAKCRFSLHDREEREQMIQALKKHLSKQHVNKNANQITFSQRNRKRQFWWIKYTHATRLMNFTWCEEIRKYPLFMIDITLRNWLGKAKKNNLGIFGRKWRVLNEHCSKELMF